jgi:regulation of enolase protein 1 (concanavalin A-like superfamily)
MRSKWMTSILILGLSAVAAQAQNQIPNWEFDQPATLTSIWNLWRAENFTGLSIVEGAKLSGRYAMKVDIGTGAIDVLQIFRSYLKLEQGQKYYISFMAKADAPRPVTVQLQARTLYNWQVYWVQANVQLTTEPKTFNYEYTHTGATVGGTGVFNNDIDFHFLLAGNGTDLYLDRIWLGTEPPPPPDKTLLARAYDPVPDDGTGDVPVDTPLSWGSGVYAQTHNVYFGTSFADVNTATVPVSKGQTGTTFQPAGPLEYGKTYYWRVDEVNGAPDNTVFKGDVWRFTTEPYAYPITGVTATASSQDKTTTTPANTVNASGLTNDLHGTVSDTMWLSSMTGAQPTWIRYQFNQVYKLQELWVWNHNSDFEPVLGYGFKDVAIETSLDGTTWTPLKEVQFAQAPAAAGYAHNSTVPLDGVMARYVRLTAKSNWSMVGLKQYGLAEVRFYHVPVTARAPQPANDAENVGIDATLNWRPGRDATSHNVTFNTDRAAVANGTAASQTVTAHRFAPASLAFGTIYYWKVDEVGAATYPGSVWNFTTQQYAVVEDFESYTDDEGSRIYETWIDGWTNGTGSVVGYLQAPFAERVIIHGGKQAMPFEYNNIKTPFYSEAQRTFATPLDLTVGSATTLALWYRGYPQGFADKGGNAFTVSSTGTDIWGNSDQFRFVYKQLSGNGSLTARVDSLVRSDAWSKAGVMIRETLDAGSKHATAVVTPDNGTSFQRRETTSGASTSADATGVKAPYWVRITRTGNAFKAERSPDGKTWTQIGTDLNIVMASAVYVGLAVTSHNANAYSTAEFSNVAATGTVTGGWQSASIGVSQWSNGAAPLYVTVEDKAGKTKTVAHPDPAATAVSAWTQWRIALSDLSGVNLAAVKKLTIGAGDRANPKPTAGGMLYVDDIQFGTPILPVGLVAHYTLEDNVKDVSGNGHDGVILGAPTYVDGPAGKGKAMLFPGTAGNGVDLGRFNPSEKTGMLSVALWAKWNGLTTQWQGLIGKRTAWDAAQMMWQIEANQTTGALTFSRNGSGPGSGNPVLKVGEWTHVAVTFDKTTARFYVNGTQTGSGGFSFGSDKNSTLEFGCDNSGGGNPFNGALDDVRLYDIVLTPAEVLTLAGK